MSPFCSPKKLPILFLPSHIFLSPSRSTFLLQKLNQVFVLWELFQRYVAFLVNFLARFDTVIIRLFLKVFNFCLCILLVFFFFLYSKSLFGGECASSELLGKHAKYFCPQFLFLIELSPIVEGSAGTFCIFDSSVLCLLSFSFSNLSESLLMLEHRDSSLQDLDPLEPWRSQEKVHQKMI